MDFFELFQSEGNKRCLIIIDKYIIWVEAFPTYLAEMIMVVKILGQDIIPRVGLLGSISLNNG